MRINIYKLLDTHLFGTPIRHMPRPVSPEDAGFCYAQGPSMEWGGMV